MNEFSKYQTDHLLLLVGKNPLPNAIAGKLLVKPDGRITMLYTLETAPAIVRLDKFLHGIKFNPPVRIEESDANSIYKGIFQALEGSEKQSVGLHYTGGTKAMSVHAYSALKKWGMNGTRCVFSYLDARSLEIIFDPDDPESMSGETVYAGNGVIVTIDQLIDLHGWSYKKEYGREIIPIKQPVLPRSANTLAHLYSSARGARAWVAWKLDELSKCRKNRSSDWDEDKIQRAALCLQTNGLLQPVSEVLAEELNLTTPNLQIPAVSHRLKIAGADFCEWLNGKWLEHHTLRCLIDLNSPPHSLELHDQCNSVRTNEVDFEVDVTAIRGYQLFAFSCGTGLEKKDRKELKMKLFEASVRARQLGGDEARIGLICPSDDPVTLESQLIKELDLEGRIKVFGQDDLRDLKASLAAWIKEQSRIP